MRVDKRAARAERLWREGEAEESFRSPATDADIAEDARKTEALSPDEAIKHAEDCVDDTPCGRNHGQLAEWLRELKGLRQRLQPDPDWEEVCAKCAEDGCSEPPDCEYFGEPNGCNSPIYGQHPKMCGRNAAKLREAAVLALSLLDLEEGVPSRVVSQKDIDFIRSALAEPARNCDMPLAVDGPADNNADKAWLVFKRHNPDAYFDVSGLLRCIDWLFAPATERKGETDGSK